MFAGDVGRHARRAQQSGRGRGVDDGPATGLQQARNFVLHAQPHAREIHGDDRCPIRLGVVRRGGQYAFDAGVVERAIQPAVRPDHRVHHRLDLCHLRHVRLQTERLAARLADHADGFLGARPIHVRGRDLGAFAREYPRRGPSDARSRAGDQRNLALRQICHAFPPSSESGARITENAGKTTSGPLDSRGEEGCLHVAYVIHFFHEQITYT